MLHPGEYFRFRPNECGNHGTGTSFCILVLTVVCLLPAKALAQGETTSAIVGQVRDTTNAVVPGRHGDDHKSRDRPEAQRQDR